MCPSPAYLGDEPVDWTLPPQDISCPVPFQLNILCLRSTSVQPTYRDRAHAYQPLETLWLVMDMAISSQCKIPSRPIILVPSAILIYPRTDRRICSHLSRVVHLLRHMALPHDDGDFALYHVESMTSSVDWDSDRMGCAHSALPSVLTCVLTGFTSPPNGSDGSPHSTDNSTVLPRLLGDGIDIDLGLTPVNMSVFCDLFEGRLRPTGSKVALKRLRFTTGRSAEIESLRIKRVR